MSITVTGDDLNLKSVDWDHLLTEHGLAGANSTRFNSNQHEWQRKSKWFNDDNEDAVKANVNRAFNSFRDDVKRQGMVTLTPDGNGYVVWDTTLAENIGTGLDGNSTKRVRLVMVIKNSGDTSIVTAFPL